MTWRCVLCSVFLVLCACSGTSTPDGPPALTPDPVEVSVFAINDLHGHLEGPSGKVKLQGERVASGGVDTMAAHLDRLRAAHPNSAFVCAGDLVGASPLLSALFQDEPTVEAMNLMKMDVLAVGNHEFDEGVDELLRLQKGGCHPEKGCRQGHTYEGAAFPFLAANVLVKQTNKTLFEPYVIKAYGAVRVGFIGLTFEDTPQAVSPDAVAPVRFLNEVETINRYTKELQAQGVEAIVVVIHEGGRAKGNTDINDCKAFEGPIADIAREVDDGVDAIVAGHTHQVFNCTIDDKIVTSAKSYGRVLTHIKLSIDPKTGQVVSKSATNIANTRDVAPNAAVAAHVDAYKKIVEPMANRRVAQIPAALARDASAAGESLLGLLIADAQVAETRPAQKGGAQFALMNPGGIRASLDFKASGQEGEGVVTYSEAQRVQPFGNTLVTMTLTGAQVKSILEAQFRPDKTVILQPSSELTYTWDASAPLGARVVPGTLKVKGQPVVDDQTYRVTVNGFLSTGGDGFKTFAQGAQRVGGRVDLDVFVDYLQANQPLVLPTLGRVRLKPKQ